MVIILLTESSKPGYVLQRIGPLLMATLQAAVTSSAILFHHSVNGTVENLYFSCYGQYGPAWSPYYLNLTISQVNF